MKIKPSLQQVRLLKRYKRFLADVELKDGKIITVHCPNTGSMKNCLVPDSRAWISDSGSETRKYRHTLEIVTTPAGGRAGINTGRANHLVREAIENNLVKELRGYQSIRSEVPYGLEKSRIDFLLEQHVRDKPDCYVEVKNVTMETGKTTGVFPDAVTERGSKHLREMINVVRRGHRAVMFYCVQHSNIQSMRPAVKTDPVYAETLLEAMAAGVEVVAYGASLTAREITIDRRVTFRRR
jgi:sugar fermentation stimulation protein A